MAEEIKIDLENYSFVAEIEGTQEMSMPDTKEEEISWGSVNVDETVQIQIYDRRAPLGEIWHVDNVYVRNCDDEEIHDLCMESIRKYEERKANG